MLEFRATVLRINLVWLQLRNNRFGWFVLISISPMPVVGYSFPDLKRLTVRLLSIMQFLNMVKYRYKYSRWISSGIHQSMNLT